MARSPGEPDPADGSALGESETVAFPLGGGGGKADNVYTIAPGTIVGRKYRVVRTIGRGGMGIVVEARHLDLDACVAIKFLLPDFMSYKEAAERFMREARAVAQLQSHHVARVLDVSVLDSGEPYMVMELLEGRDLAGLVAEKGQLKISDAIDHVAQACDAIAEAHARGIIHRDLKPANLFLTQRPDGAPFIKLLDFGVSKVLSGGSGDVSLTQTTTILGSALYMSPEQMRSAKSVDNRTDIYALGACLFEMIGGKPPYYAGSFPELCAKIYTSPPAPLAELRPDVPAGLVEVLEKSLAREPDDRYQTIAELLHALVPYARRSTRVTIASVLRQHAPELRVPGVPTTLESTPPPPDRGDDAAPLGSVAAVSRSAGGARGGAEGGEERRLRRGALLVLAGFVTVGALVWGAHHVDGPWSALLGTGGAAPEAGSTAPVDAPATAGTAGAVEAVLSAEVAADAGAGAPDASDAGVSDAGAPDSGAPDSGAPDSGAPDSGAPDADGVPAAAAASGGAVTVPAAGTGGRPPQEVAPPAGPRPREPGWGLPGPAATPDATKTPPPPVNTDLSQETCTAVMPDGSRKTVPCN